MPANDVYIVEGIHVRNWEAGSLGFFVCFFVLSLVEVGRQSVFFLREKQYITCEDCTLNRVPMGRGTGG